MWHGGGVRYIVSEMLFWIIYAYILIIIGTPAFMATIERYYNLEIYDVWWREYLIHQCILMVTFWFVGVPMVWCRAKRKKDKIENRNNQS